MVNCWLAKTPLQLALIVVLIIAIPFLIGMIATYAAYGAENAKTKSEDCDRLCCSFRNAHRVRYMVPVRPKELTNFTRFRPLFAKRQVNQNKERPLIGSLTNHFRSTASDELDFDVVCPVAIISETWGLADGECDVNSTLVSIPIDSNGSYNEDGPIFRKIMGIKRSPSSPPVIAIKFQTIENHYVQPLVEIPISKIFTENVNIHYKSWNTSQPIEDRKMVGFTRSEVLRWNGTFMTVNSGNQFQNDYKTAIITDDSHQLIGISRNNTRYKRHHLNLTDIYLTTSWDLAKWLKTIGALI